ncbi:MAG: DNA mismatch repair protein MutS [Helcococcus sp.]|nr:DNA mismatch repair protein MutS [Helcococcus sp.]
MLIDKIDYDRLTPMMRQYVDLKKENREILIFYRLGDFYEMFLDDALIVAKELELVLTGRDAGLDEKVPMAGVPHHSASSYITRLVDKGFKVGIVEQLEDPATAKGIVKRNIVRIVTPGTLIDMEGKDSRNNFLLSIYNSKDSFGVSYVDITTGEFNTTEIINSQNIERDLLDLIVKVNPKEIVLNKEIEFKSFKSYIENYNIILSYVDLANLDIKSIIKNISKKLRRFDREFFIKKIFSVISSSMLLDYIYLFRNETLEHIDNIKYIDTIRYMKIDAHTRENLEIHKNLQDNSKRNSLLSILDKCNTPMGSRKINSWLEFPLINKNDINIRLDMIEYFILNHDKMESISIILSSIYDLERILSKISFKNANARDLLNLRNSIENLPKLKVILGSIENRHFNNLYKKFDTLEDLFNLVNDSIREDVPMNITEGEIIKPLYSEQLDKLKYDSTHGKELLLEYELEERKNTNISKLKVSYNKNTGHYIEVTNSQISKVPDHYIRRQTLKNSERYITDRLNEISEMILGSQNEIIELEYRLFTEIRDKISSNSTRIKAVTDIISTLDVINTLAKVAINNNYTRPIFNEENYFRIKAGRHPVVELSLGMNEFVSNDTFLGKENKIIQIITGPNMAGKSTYMRQVALIILMAQIGSFVPASACDISISDALFTRIGASDNLAKGDSTFMVEMNEMSNIINNADETSFVILDEVGRGTSTNDGYSIAKSIIEYMSRNNKSKTLFATHYHELTDLDKVLPNVENLKVEIEETNQDIVFLRKIVKGKSNKSYGIEVAKLSGLPDEIIFRANTILESINDNQIIENDQLSFIADKNIKIERDILIKELSNTKIENMTPIQAIDTLNRFINKAKDV